MCFLHIVRSIRDVYYDTSTRKNDLRLFMRAREINIYAIHTEYDNRQGKTNLNYIS